jgi:integrase
MALKKAGITNFRFHDLRHTFASYAAQNGATNIQIAAALGYKTLQMVHRYSHVRGEHTQSLSELMEALIDSSEAG